MSFKVTNFFFPEKVRIQFYIKEKEERKGGRTSYLKFLITQAHAQRKGQRGRETDRQTDQDTENPSKVGKQ